MLWGVYFAGILILERAFLLNILEKSPRVIAHLYSLFLIGVGFLIFSHNDLGAAWSTFLELFVVGTRNFVTPAVRYTLLRLIPPVILSAIGATPLPKRVWERLQERHPRWRTASIALFIGLFGVCVAYLVDSTFSPFEYTQF